MRITFAKTNTTRLPASAWGWITSFKTTAHSIACHHWGWIGMVSWLLALGGADLAQAQGTNLFQESFDRPNVSDDWLTDFGVWQIGTPNVGPGGAHSGTNVLCTGLNGHGGNVGSTVAGPSFVVPAASENPRLRFWHFYSLPDEGYGFVYIKAAGKDWEAISPKYMGNNGRIWSQVVLNLADYAGLRVQLGFSYASWRGGGEGWFIDDLQVLTGALPAFQNPEDFDRASAQDQWISDQGVWQIGTPAVGPGDAHSGANVLCTGLSGHGGNVSSMVAGPTWVVPPANENPRLRFWHFYSLPDEAFAYVYIKADGKDWEALSPKYMGNNGRIWSQVVLDLAAYAGKPVRLGFYYGSWRGGGEGWFIDDLQVLTGALPAFQNPEDFDRASAEDQWISDQGVWQIGTPAVGPGGAHSGANVLCTGLSGHGGNVSSLVAGPTWVVPPANENPRLRFWHFYSLPDEAVAYVYIKVEGKDWEAISPKYTGNNGRIWSQVALDLAAYAGKPARLGFYYGSWRGGGEGWFIDDLKILYTPSVNQKPALNPLGPFTVRQGQALTFTAAGSDPDAGQTLTYRLKNAPAGASIDSKTGVFTWQPSLAQCAISYYTFTVEVTDDASVPLSATQEVFITVTGGLRLTLHRENGLVYVTLAGGDPGKDYALQESPDLKSWATVLQFMKPGQSFIFMSPQNTGLPHSFFRISEY
jgi:hypothetical protein